MPEQKPPIFPITWLGLNFNPQNTSCIPAVKNIAFLELVKFTGFRSDTRYISLHFENNFLRINIQGKNDIARMKAWNF